MQSFQFEIDEQSECATRFISRVRGELVDALLAEKAERGLTQNDIAERLNVSPSMISRQLSGEANLTLRSVAELAWALGYDEPYFKLLKLKEGDRQNHYPLPTSVVSFSKVGVVHGAGTTATSSDPHGVVHSGAQE